MGENEQGTPNLEELRSDASALADAVLEAAELLRKHGAPMPGDLHESLQDYERRVSQAADALKLSPPLDLDKLEQALGRLRSSRLDEIKTTLDRLGAQSPGYE